VSFADVASDSDLCAVVLGDSHHSSGAAAAWQGGGGRRRFGAGASGTVFGARGATTALSRATAILAAIFMINSLALAYMGMRPAEAPKTILDEAASSKPAASAGKPAPPPASAPAGTPASAPASTPAPAPAPK